MNYISDYEGYEFNKMFDEHFEKFINNDIKIRKYFNVRIYDLINDYPDIFECNNKKTKTGIRLKNGDNKRYIKWKAKKILEDFYCDPLLK